jgi:hypothetical protein
MEHVHRFAALRPLVYQVKHNCSLSQSTQQMVIEARDHAARLAVTNKYEPQFAPNSRCTLSK